MWQYNNIWELDDPPKYATVDQPASNRPISEINENCLIGRRYFTSIVSKDKVGYKWKRMTLLNHLSYAYHAQHVKYILNDIVYITVYIRNGILYIMYIFSHDIKLMFFRWIRRRMLVFNFVPSPPNQPPSFSMQRGGGSGYPNPLLAELRNYV